MIETTALHEARAALSTVSARTADLVASSPDTAVAIPGSSWTVRETGAHLAVVGFRYAGMVHCEPIQYPSLAPEECARRNDELNADISKSHPAELAALVREGAERLLAATASCADARDVLFDGGVVLPVRHLVGLAVAEHLLHGFDIAVAVHRPWPIDSGHAVIGLFANNTRDSGCLDPATSAGHTAGYGVELTTGQRYTVRFVDGEFDLDPQWSGPVDCTITADPVALLLVHSRRVSRWAMIALGMLRASGDRPELALGFHDLFRFP